MPTIIFQHSLFFRSRERLRNSNRTRTEFLFSFTSWPSHFISSKNKTRRIGEKKLLHQSSQVAYEDKTKAEVVTKQQSTCLQTLRSVGSNPYGCWAFFLLLLSCPLKCVFREVHLTQNGANNVRLIRSWQPCLQLKGLSNNLTIQIIFNKSEDGRKAFQVFVIACSHRPKT